MDRKRRLTIFGVSALFSAFSLYMIFIYGKEDQWLGFLPTPKVKSLILNPSTPIEYTPEAKCQLDCIQATEGELEIAVKDGEIQFLKSEKRNENPQVYRIHVTLNGKGYETQIQIAKRDVQVDGGIQIKRSVSCLDVLPLEGKLGCTCP